MKTTKEIDEYLDNELTSNREHCIVSLLLDSDIIPYRDGNMWCVLVGKDLQSGHAGFGETIYEATINFLKDLNNDAN